VLLSLLVTTTASAACTAGSEPWTVIVGDRAVPCCARHGIGAGTKPFDRDAVMLWCRLLRHRPSLWVRSAVEPTPDYRGGAPLAEYANACTKGPHFRRPPGRKPYYIHLRRGLRSRRHCCTLDVDQIVLAHPEDGWGSVRSFSGTIQCRRRSVRIEATATEEP
jgi:hypothetical protein